MSNVHGEPPAEYAGRAAADGWRPPMLVGRPEQEWTHAGYSTDHHDHPFGHRMDDATTWRTCWYCGGMHPDDLLAAIEAQGWGPHIDYDAAPDDFEEYLRWLAELKARPGLRLSEADWKYGFPHKFYVEGLPNPQAGQPVCSLGYSSDQSMDESKHMLHPAGPTSSAKFYTEHLVDATDFPTLAERLADYIPNIHFLRDEEGRVKWFGRRGEGVR